MTTSTTAETEEMQQLAPAARYARAYHNNKNNVLSRLILSSSRMHFHRSRREEED